MLHRNDSSPVINHSHVTAIFRVIQRVGFHRSGVIHISKRSLLYQEYEECFEFYLNAGETGDTCMVNCHFRHSIVWLQFCKEYLCLKRQLTVHVSPISRALRFTKARKTCHGVVGSSIWSIPYSGELCSKNYIIKSSTTTAAAAVSDDRVRDYGSLLSWRVQGIRACAVKCLGSRFVP